MNKIKDIQVAMKIINIETHINLFHQIINNKKNSNIIDIKL